MQSKSKLFGQVQADVATHKDALLRLRADITGFLGDTMAELRALHVRADQMLSELSDETMVLKEIGGWPHDKCASIREAVIRDETLQKYLAQCVACTSRCREVEDSGKAGKEGEKQLARLEEAFGKLGQSIESLKREKEEMQARYYKHGIPFDFHAIQAAQSESISFAKLHMNLTLALVDAKKVMQGQASTLDAVPGHWQALLKRCFEFAFKVQQFAGGTDDDATRLFEAIFAAIEKLHQLQRATIQQNKAAKAAAAAAVEAAAAPLAGIEEGTPRSEAGMRGTREDAL